MYKYVGHFDITLKNCVTALLDQLVHSDVFNNEHSTGCGGWVNGNNYEDPGETFGIIQFDPKKCETYGILSNNPQSAHNVKTHHQWLAKCQGTMFAVVLVHTPEEHDIFALFQNIHWQTTTCPCRDSNMWTVTYNPLIYKAAYVFAVT
jgi:hypothetical protein